MKTNFTKLAAAAAFVWATATFTLPAAGTYSYDSNGRLTLADYGDGQRIFYTYDLNGNLTRRNIVTFTDTDNDGLEDSWETNPAHFGNLSRDGAGDFDNDGLSDAAEFLAGTNPNDANSVFKVTTVHGVCTLTWSSVAGKNYRVQYKNNLADANWFDLSGDVAASGVTASKTDSPPNNQNQRIYRVMLIP